MNMLYFLLSLNILLRESISGSVLFAESQTAEGSGTEFRETNYVTLDPSFPSSPNAAAETEACHGRALAK